MKDTKRVRFNYLPPQLIRLFDADSTRGLCFADGNDDSGVCQNGYDAGTNCVGGDTPISGYCDNGVTGNCDFGGTAGCITGSGG